MDQAAEQELRRSLARFLDRHAPVEQARQVAEGKPFDRGTWRRLCTDLGVLGLLVPEEAGGQGAGPEMLGVCAEELGRVLYSGPWLASGVLAAAALAALASDEVRDAHLPELLSGEVIGTLAIHDDDDGDLDFDGEAVRVSARPDGDAHVLDGVKCLVPDLAVADIVLVAARVQPAGDAGLLLVRIDQVGVTCREHQTTDHAHTFGRLELDNARGVMVAHGSRVVPQLRRLLDVAGLMVAAESVGASEAVLRMGLEYSKVRQQFDRPIGGFQAVKHKFADMHRDIESARYAVRAALTAAEDADVDLRMAASVAKARAGDAFVGAARENIHLHGGIGYTWEHDAHLYYRRALLNRAWLGHPSRHRERIAGLLGL